MAAELHTETQPGLLVDTQIIPDETKEFSLDKLVRVVLSVNHSELHDDYAKFGGMIVAPPEMAGKEAILSVIWEEHDILGSLLVQGE